MLPRNELAARINSLDLTTPRLHLRRTTSDDDEVQISHETNPTIMNTIRDPLPPEEVEQRVRNLGGPWRAVENSWVGLSLVDSDTRNVIGFFFLRVVSFENQSMELGYRLHPDYWRRGYAAEAAQHLLAYCDEMLQVRKMVAYCLATNEGSVGLLEKLGFSREGCLVKHSALGGQWRDDLVYGLVLAPQRGVP